MKKEKILEELERLQEIKNYRVLREQDEKLLNLSSNDYLGIANDVTLKDEFYKEYITKIYSRS